MIVVYAYSAASHSLGAVLHSGRVLASSGTDFQHRLPAHILVVSSLQYVGRRGPLSALYVDRGWDRTLYVARRGPLSALYST